MNNSASSGEASAPLTEPPTPWLRQPMREESPTDPLSRQQCEEAKEDGSVGKCEDQSSEPQQP